MTGRGTNVFFVPYRPQSKAKTKPSTPDDEPDITPQKHAAREYHRKAKLDRLAKLNALHSRHVRSTSLPVSTSDSVSSARPPLPRSNTSTDEKEPHRSFAVYDAGTGQLDPFNACVPSGVPSYALDILDYATSRQWRVFSSSNNALGEGAVKKAVLACAMQCPAAFWTIIFAGATHSAYLQRGPQGDELGYNRMLRLSYKAQAIKELNREIQALQGVASDELLLAIITLAAHGSAEQLEPPAEEEKEEHLSALEAVQNFQYYGRMRWEVAHLKAVYHLVHEKGGLHTIKMPGLANAIGLGDIFFAFQDMRAPFFPLLVPTSLIMSTWPAPPGPLSLSVQHLTAGFQHLEALYYTDGFSALMQIISNARLITVGLDAYMSQDTAAPSLNRIVWARNFLTHDLLSSPAALPSSVHHNPHRQLSPSSLSILSVPHALYNLLRLSLLAYTLLVLFPMPRVTGLHAKLSQHLMLALDDCTVLELWTTEWRELLLWSTLLGGIVAAEEEEEDDDDDEGDVEDDDTPTPAREGGAHRSWFADMARRGVRNLRLGISASEGLEAKTKGKEGSSTASTRELAQHANVGRQRQARRGDPADIHSGASPVLPSWPAIRALCVRFLWFDGHECDGRGQAFWEKSVTTSSSSAR